MSPSASVMRAISRAWRETRSLEVKPAVAAVGYLLRLASTKAMMTDPDQHACGPQPREQQSLVPTPPPAAGRGLEPAACALLRARPRRTRLPSTAGTPAPARRR